MPTYEKLKESPINKFTEINANTPSYIFLCILFIKPARRLFSY